MSELTAAFFDLGDTLGTATLGGAPPHLVSFDVFPFVPSLLADLRHRGLRLGIISNTGDDKKATVEAGLIPTGLLAPFDPTLLVYSGDEGVTKSSPEIFDRAAARAGRPPAECLFVGESAAERAVAAGAGWAVCPHPLLVTEVLAGQPLRYVRVIVPTTTATTPWRTELARRAFVPQHLSGPRGTTLYGLTSQRVALELANMRFGVEFLGDPDLPRLTELYLLRDDLARSTGFLATAGDAARVFAEPEASRMVVSATPEGMVVAVPPTVADGVDAFHFDSARHGHTLKLTPDPLLWASATEPAAGLVAGFAAAAPTVSAAALTELGNIKPAAIGHTVRRYSGLEPLDGTSGTRVRSRHILEVGNARVVTQLVTDFEAIGGGRLLVLLHAFNHGGRTLHNVEAELAGGSPELALVTAHLDSTAAADDDFNPATSPAPGADDDASGVAAVLAVAERFLALTKSNPPARTVRFVLFNAEEQGLVGSRAYARRSKTRGETIAAVWQMDMIGFNSDDKLKWEVHAGFETSPTVEARSRALADLLAGVASQVSPELPPVQVLHSAAAGGDPADGRSDHTSFQAHGYPAVVVSEDFFIDEPGGPQPDTNPNYHRHGDTKIDEVYAAAITRAVAAAAWLTANPMFQPAGLTAGAFRPKEPPMPLPRELDTRTRSTAVGLVGGNAVDLPRPRTFRNALTGSQAVVAENAPAASAGGSLVERALAFVQRNAAGLGFQQGQTPEFTPDPNIQRTTAGSAAVNLKQTYRGLTVFQMSRTVRFNPNGQPVDAAGDSSPLSDNLSIEPRLSAEAAVLKAAVHLASSGVGERVRDQFGQEAPLPTIDVKEFVPEVVSGFPLPSRPTVLDRGPFENLIPAYLLIFCQPGRVRVAWHIVLTLPGYTDQYTLIVAADDLNGEILYSKSTMRRAAARGRVFEFSPGIADRRMIPFPRPIVDYPAMPASPISGFPADWVAADKTFGNSTRATLNTTTTTLPGQLNNGVVEFDPQPSDGDDQKLLNIFYFCNYMHDFLYILGFDEASGNFQQTNFTNTGAEGDPVRARAHSGPVNGTANMATGPDGLPPLMNMGLVVLKRDPNTGAIIEGRHTAFDADVVFHEYVHGLTNRLVGGRLNAHALDKLQSGGMGEGWSDYFALTVQNFFHTAERVVTGDWVAKNAAGIRRAPYDDNYPFKYGSLSQSPEVHDIGEVWCAALMMMTRKLVAALGDKQQGYRLAWVIVCDGLKLTPANPTFLDARDAILRALEDLSTTNKIPPAVLIQARRAAWQSFAHFEMGANASSDDADDVDGIIPDTSIPAGV